MISLCINLAAAIGLRPAESALRIVFDALGVEEKLPDWTSIRTWLCRFGVATLEEPVEAADDWVWMADHSNQIGREKVLVDNELNQNQFSSPHSHTPTAHIMCSRD